jgi:hypothetical protein
MNSSFMCSAEIDETANANPVDRTPIADGRQVDRIRTFKSGQLEGLCSSGPLLRHAERIITKHLHVGIHRNEGIRLGELIDVCAEGFIDLLALLG